MSSVRKMSKRIREDLVATLGRRQMQVFRMMADGLTSQQTAVQMGVSRKTVEAHKHQIKRKLRVYSNNELLRMAVLWEFVYGDRVQNQARAQ